MFFFFKQKTAYDMRISDWSSDVCSSDLVTFRAQCQRGRRCCGVVGIRGLAGVDAARPRLGGVLRDCVLGRWSRAAVRVDTTDVRSEEHTSELQSLMRISYAVFCLKKKKQQDKNNSIFVKYHNTKNQSK